MTKFSNLVEKVKKIDAERATKLFGKEFRSPGHIPICVASEKLLNSRKGHTELVVSMMKIAGLPEAGSGCEIIGNNGKAMSKKYAKKYADENNLVFLEGKDIIKAWKKWSK